MMCAAHGAGNDGNLSIRMNMISQPYIELRQTSFLSSSWDELAVRVIIMNVTQRHFSFSVTSIIQPLYCRSGNLSVALYVDINCVHTALLSETS